MTEVVKALQRYLGSFGISAYQENSVPTDAVFPYITYSPIALDWDSEGLLQVRIWDYGGEYFSIQRLLGLVDRLRESVGEGLTLSAKPAGYIRLNKGEPFAQLQPMQDADVRVAYINLDIKTIIN